MKIKSIEIRKCGHCNTFHQLYLCYGDLCKIFGWGIARTQPSRLNVEVYTHKTIVRQLYWLPLGHWNGWWYILRTQLYVLGVNTRPACKPFLHSPTNLFGATLLFEKESATVGMPLHFPLSIILSSWNSMNHPRERPNAPLTWTIPWYDKEHVPSHDKQQQKLSIHRPFRKYIWLSTYGKHKQTLIYLQAN